MQTIKAILIWPFRIFMEPGEDSKPSFNRVAAAFIIWKMAQFVDAHIRMTSAGTIDVEALKAVHIPDAYMYLFMVLVGFTFLAKALDSMSPAVLAIAQAMLAKAGVKVNTESTTTTTTVQAKEESHTP